MILKSNLRILLNYMKLLLDVHCQGQYLSNRSEIEKEHELLCVGHHDDLPEDMDDSDIAKYAEKYGFVVVTKDVDFVNLCKDQKVPVGVLKGNRLYLISESIQLFGGNYLIDFLLLTSLYFLN